MADFYTQFSCILDVGTAETAERAKVVRDEFADELDREEGSEPGFEMSIDHQTGPGALWIYSDDQGEPEHVIAFVKRCAEAFALTGRWGFQWALTCSRPRLDGFGGGAHVLDLATGKTVEWLDCEHWLAGQLTAATNLTQEALA